MDARPAAARWVDAHAALRSVRDGFRELAGPRPRADRAALALIGALTLLACAATTAPLYLLARVEAAGGRRVGLGRAVAAGPGGDPVPAHGRYRLPPPLHRGPGPGGLGERRLVWSGPGRGRRARPGDDVLAGLPARGPDRRAGGVDRLQDRLGTSLDPDRGRRRRVPRLHPGDVGRLGREPAGHLVVEPGQPRAVLRRVPEELSRLGRSPIRWSWPWRWACR